MEQVNETLQFQFNKRGQSMSAAHRHIPCTLKLAYCRNYYEHNFSTYKINLQVFTV